MLGHVSIPAQHTHDPLTPTLRLIAINGSQMCGILPLMRKAQLYRGKGLLLTGSGLVTNDVEQVLIAYERWLL